MNELEKKTNVPPPDVPETQRRRVGLVVHDDRGNAFVSWRDAPADFRRPVLEILGGGGLNIASDDVSYDPYANRPPARRATGGVTTRTDLRKLSEHIKRMRELEARKRDSGE